MTDIVSVLQMRTSTPRYKDMDLISASSPPSLVSHPVLSAISVEELKDSLWSNEPSSPAQILNTLCLKKDPE